MDWNTVTCEVHFGLSGGLFFERVSMMVFVTMKMAVESEQIPAATHIKSCDNEAKIHDDAFPTTATVFSVEVNIGPFY